MQVTKKSARVRRGASALVLVLLVLSAGGINGVQDQSGGTLYHGDGIQHEGIGKGLLQDIQELIVGEDAPCLSPRFTYMVSLQTSQNIHMCGGVLIHPRWVLTAAHCVDDDGLGAAPILRIGACNLKDNKEDVEILRPSRTLLHEDWTGHVADGNDIALLMLSTPSKHTPIALPPETLTLWNGQPVAALGWGVNEDNVQQDRLQLATKMSFVHNLHCNASEAWNGTITNTMMCAYGFGHGQGQDACPGDSGGPLIDMHAPGSNVTAGKPNLDILLGIISFGEDNVECGKSTRPGVYTRVISYLDWIAGKMGGNTPGQGTPPAAKDLLELAAMKESEDTQKEADELLSKGVDPNACCADGGDTALHQTAENDNAVVASALVRAGAAINVRNDDGDAPLHKAAYFNAFRVTQVLVTARANVDARNSFEQAPLHVAALRNALRVTEALVTAGANVDARSDREETALHEAASRNAFRVARVLLTGGAAVDARSDRGWTPLHVAAINDASRTADALLVAGANIDEQDDKGWTPLHWAAFNGELAFVKLLISRGADPAVQGNDGTLPRDVICGSPFGPRACDDEAREAFADLLK